MNAITLKINGVMVYDNPARISRKTDTVIANGSLEIPHNPNGSKTVTWEAGAAIYTSVVNSTGSGSFDLDTIIRNATITNAPNFYDSGNPQLNYYNPSGNKVVSLQAAIFAGDNVICDWRNIPKENQSYRFDITPGERQNIYLFCQGKSNTIKYKLYTKMEDTFSFTDEKYATLTFEDDFPVIEGISIIDTGKTLSFSDGTSRKTTDLTGDNKTLIKGISDASVSMNPRAVKGASIVEQSITNADSTIQSAETIIKNIGDNQISFYIRDSRKNITVKNDSCNMVDYIPIFAKPTIKYRIQSETQMDLNIYVGGGCFTGNFGVIDNTIKVQVRWSEKQNPANNSGWVNLSPSLEKNYYSVSHIFKALDYRKSYIVEVWVQDLATEYKPEGIEVVAKPLFEWDDKSFKFNIPVEIPTMFIVSPSTPGMWGGYGYCWSKLGNTYNNFIRDNYYLAIDSSGRIWTGVQKNGAQSITWVNKG